MRLYWRHATVPMSSMTPPSNAASSCILSSGIFLGCFAEQLARWRHERPTSTQSRELDRLDGQLERLRTVLENILQLAEELKQGTIERVLAKSDLELGLEALLRRANGR